MNKKLDWQLLESSYLLEDHWISVRVDTCRMPDGRLVAPYYVVETHPWVTVVPVTPKEEIVCVRLYRHGLQQTVWELPGGLIDEEDSDPVASCRRELLEETGYSSQQFTYLGQGAPDPARYQGLSYYYLAHDVHPVAVPQWEETEEMEIAIIPIADVLRMLLDGGLVDTSHQSALFYALLKTGYLTSGEDRLV